MRILVVQESDWIEKGPHQSHHVMERLSREDHQIRVIDFEILWRQTNKSGLLSRRRVFDGVHKAIDTGGVTVVRPPILKIPVLDYVSLFVSHRREIKRQLKEFKPDVVVGFGILNAYNAIRVTRKKDIPFVYYIIDELHTLLPHAFLRPIARHIERSNMKRADKVVAINENLRQYTLRMGAEKVDTEVVPGGIDLERFDPGGGYTALRERYGIREDDVLILFTGFFRGRIADLSGLKEIAEELPNVDDGHIKFMVVGEGDADEYLRAVRQRFELGDRLILAGRQPYSDIPAFIGASDVCVLPYKRAPLTEDIVPIKMYEYIAMQKPVISTDLPGVKKEFGMDNGVVYVEKPEDIVWKAKELHEHNELERFGEQARQFAEGYDWNRITEKFENILTELAAKATKRSRG